MTDLKPGDIVRHDAIYTGQVKLGAGQVVAKGDFLVPDGAASDVYDKIGAVGDIVLINGIVQAQADYDNTGGQDGDIVADVFTAPSVVIGAMGGAVSPSNGIVKYSGGKWVAADADDFAAVKAGATYEGTAGETVLSKSADAENGILRLRA